MEPWIVGVVSGLGCATGVALWTLLVRPASVLSVFARQNDLDDGPAGVRAMRWALALSLFLIAFAAGGITAFLRRTMVP